MTIHELKSSQATRIAASIELAPKQAIESQDLPSLFPAGSRVYITDMGTDTVDTLTTAARRVSDLGYKPVPHFACRRLTTKAALEVRIQRAAEEAGVTDVLIIGGGLERPAGEFNSTMQVLETGFFDRYGITEMGIAGHPEGSPDFSEAVAIEALRLKKNFGERTGARLRIVTQFGFDAEHFIIWSEGLRDAGIDLPVHLGIAGPAKITTLIKYAAMCGIGNSITYLKKNALSLTALATSHSPEGVVGPIERHVLENPTSNIKQIHVFPFGGIRQASEWLVERGTWNPHTVAPVAAAQ
ncbi:methylenetetrahydrofolate reductase [Phyllobacterium leguminum]|uniref:Methylenetetrahydrofolate reductase n=1 Tax=Phyllobacterium leguminum TaxID=314237 RepID=A0A318TEW7_9HYPH|nr:methylenetetrahydrofolate reductase [Phyllobacterium leguminum]PYE90063.1 5,10-methylenetetrahydrofolate reductase [Phyllobacterium leguminum]